MLQVFLSVFQYVLVTNALSVLVQVAKSSTWASPCARSLPLGLRFERTTWFLLLFDANGQAEDRPRVGATFGFSVGPSNPRNPLHFDIFEGGRFKETAYQTVLVPKELVSETYSSTTTLSDPSRRQSSF